MKLLDICLKTIYFQEKDTFYHQKEGMAIWSSLSLVISNTDEIALDTVDHKPTKWHRYIKYTFEISLHGPARLQQFFSPPQSPETYAWC
jgi:hypothetical protein